MIWALAGTVSFALMTLFEYSKCRSIRRNIKRVNPWFITGLILLVIAWVGLILDGITQLDMRFWIGITALAAGAFMYACVLLIPADKKDYGRDSSKAYVSRKGLYGKMRHPGGWCFILCSVATAIAVPGTWPVAGWFALLNLVYIWLQDKYFFPVYLEGYEEYKREIRFM